MDKKSLSVGGALTHRLNLSDSILIKENHIQLLGNDVKKALELANKNGKAQRIEIEVKNEKEALKAAEAIHSIRSSKTFAIMFDNMDASVIKNSIIKLNRLENNKFIKKNNNLKNKIILFGASGGINEKNIMEYSKTRVDVLSLGILTHSAKALDISLEIID